MKHTTQTQTAELLQTPQILNLKKVIEESGGSQIVANILSVAKSGMSRKINFGIIVNNKIETINHIINEAFCKPTNYYCVQVRGCGMDMIFSNF